MGPTSSPLIFKVHRSEPELVRPAKPTPHETKLLSDIDDQEVLRFHFPMIQFYKHSPKMHGKDPARVIRRAVAETLVYYYPLAGRLREGPNRKLIVDCTGEGVLFIEADADVRLSEFGENIRPPFSCVDELLFDVPGSSAVLHSPLLLIQVTRLHCGGFIVSLRINHCMSDAVGLIQFIFAVAEIARGATAPTMTPVWERHILSARSPPQVTCTHDEYKPLQTTLTTTTDDLPVAGSFFFGPAEISALRCLHVPTRTHASQFEILAACLWKCRTAALKPDDPNQEMRMILTVNSRGKLANPPLSRGNYGNAQAFPMAVAPARELCQKPLMYALGLVKKAKLKVNDEYMKSVANLMALERHRRPDIAMTKWTCILSDVSHAGFEKVDFGWGEAVYGGPLGPDPARLTNFCLSAGVNKEGIILMVSLSPVAMERFTTELESMLHGPLDYGDGVTGTRIQKKLSTL